MSSFRLTPAFNSRWPWPTSRSRIRIGPGRFSNHFPRTTRKTPSTPIGWGGSITTHSITQKRSTASNRQSPWIQPWARAYDNLGLCYFYQNQTDLAVKNFNRAIELDRQFLRPSPWPYLNLAVAQQFLGHAQEAETNLREALRLDPQLAPAHYHLGNVLQQRGQLDAAVQEQLAAARLDDKYAEPHVALAHLYKQQGRTADAQEEVKIYLRLHPGATDREGPPKPSNP